MVLDAEEAILRAGALKTAFALQVEVVTSMEGVVVVAELQCEERVLAPRDVGVDVDFVLVFRKMCEALAAQTVEVDLGSRC